MSVEEHLRLVAHGRNARWAVERIYELFPRLAERRGNGGAALSGGEAQILAIGRALMTCPSFVVLDEPTEGLAPVIVGHTSKCCKTWRVRVLVCCLLNRILR